MWHGPSFAANPENPRDAAAKCLKIPLLRQLCLHRPPRKRNSARNSRTLTMVNRAIITAIPKPQGHRAPGPGVATAGPPIESE